MKANDGRKREKKNPSADFIDQICSLYNDIYDDREEDSSIGGDDWAPGRQALHTSLNSFQKELEGYGIKLSTAKIRKILITGGCWTTERSREVAELYAKLGSVAKVATWGWVGMLGIQIGARHLHVSYVVTLAMARGRVGVEFLGLGLRAPGRTLDKCDL